MKAKFGILLLLLIVACSKEDDPSPAGPTLDCTLLVVKYYENGGLSATEGFTYLPNGLVERADRIVDGDTYTELYTYGLNNLPDSVVRYKNSVTLQSVMKAVYDTQDRMIRFEEIFDLAEGYKHVYSYNSDNQLQSMVTTIYAPDPDIISTSHYLYPATTSRNYSRESVITSDGDDYTVTYTYDEKTNPWSLLLNFFPLTTTNNITKAVYQGTISGSATYTVAYNDQGLPTSITLSDTKLEFTYDCK